MRNRCYSQLGGTIDHPRHGPPGYFLRLFYEDKTVYGRIKSTLTRSPLSS